MRDATGAVVVSHPVEIPRPHRRTPQRQRRARHHRPRFELARLKHCLKLTRPVPSRTTLLTLVEVQAVQCGSTPRRAQWRFIIREMS